jgi:hypothetical protein
VVLSALDPNFRWDDEEGAFPTTFGHSFSSPVSPKAVMRQAFVSGGLRKFDHDQGQGGEKGA